MSIILDKNSRILVQGITGREGLYHAERMHLYAGNVVAGTSPGHGGEEVLQGKVPVFDCVASAFHETKPNMSVIFVPAAFAADAIQESINVDIQTIICITEGIPIKDMLLIKSLLKHSNSQLIGPNSPGLFTPGEAVAGIIPTNIALPGRVGVVSRSGTLTYEVVKALESKSIGISTCVGIGGDPILGTNFVEILRKFEDDSDTDKIVLIGEIGGSDEETAADFILKNVHKPVFAYIAGKSAPEGRRMGHAGAIVDGRSGSAELKIRALRQAGVITVDYPEEIADVI